MWVSCAASLGESPFFFFFFFFFLWGYFSGTCSILFVLISVFFLFFESFPRVFPVL